MASASKAYVVPGGEYLYRGITGLNPYDHPGAGDVTGIFDTGDGEGPFASANRAWNAQRLGYGVLDAPDSLYTARDESQGRYDNWSDNWNFWNNQDLTGPDGRTLFSPVHQTGLRIGQDYGVRNDDGSISDPWNTQMFQSGLGIRNNLNQDNWLDPTSQMQGLRDLNASSPYDMPNPDDYTSAMRGAADAGGGDPYLERGVGRVRNLNERTNFDKYGTRGVNQTNALEDADIASLTAGIDREAQLTLADQLPEIQQSMEAMGLGRSGAGQSAMLGSMRSIMNQANRDKQRVMADYTDRSANRRAEAINLATQQGFQGQGQEYGTLANMMRDQAQGGMQSYENYAQRAGNAALAGLGDQFQANQMNRQNEQALYSQAMQNRYGMRMGDQQALFGLLGQSGDYTMRGLDQERLGQSAALQDWFAMQDQRDRYRESRMSEYLTLDDRIRGVNQERRNQQLAASMMPVDMLMRIATGTTPSTAPRGGSTSLWGGIGAEALGGFAGAAGQWAGRTVFDRPQAFGNEPYYGMQGSDNW